MKILANDGVSPEGIEVLEKAGHQVETVQVAQEQLANYMNENAIDVILVRSATQVRKELIDQVPHLKIIGRGGVGLDNIDVDYAKSKGVEVINTPAASSESVAELVMAHILGLSRNLHNTNRDMPLEGDQKFKQLKKACAGGTELAGKTMGIIGFGRIGQAVAKKAIGLGMHVMAFDPLVKTAKIELQFFDGQLLSFEVKTTSFEDLLKNSDYISLHVPKQKEYVIGESELELMKNTAVLVNTARGGVVDEVALDVALGNNQIAYAALDVFESEPTPPIKLLMNPKLSLSPHIGGATLEAQARIGVELAEQIIAIDKK
ncbi:MAG: D-2-hydroxyacid dehydrogenase [Flavobacteriaceae bacterium]|nr:D-2-hydroxyacid dehydrogenase [Flavobacteriaceae bacterium]